MWFIKKNWFKIAVLVLLLFACLIYAYTIFNKKSEEREEKKLLDVQIYVVENRLDTIADGLRFCHGAYFSFVSEENEVFAQKCANVSIEYTDWSTQIVLVNELLPIKKDLLSIRDDFNKLANIGLHIVEPNNKNERDDLDLKIRDSLTNIRQYVSGLE